MSSGSSASSDLTTSGGDAVHRTSDDTQVERWTYGGLRRSTKNTKLDAWIDPDGNERLYPYRAGRIVGCWYDVRVRRSPDNERVTRYGDPRWVGQSDDHELVTRLAAEHRAHDQHLAVIQRMRKAKAANPFDHKIDELAHLVKTVPAPQRAGLTAYVLYRLTRVW